MTARWNVNMEPRAAVKQGTRKGEVLGLAPSQLTKRVRRSLFFCSWGPTDYQD